jgi:hypothetical protein
MEKMRIEGKPADEGLICRLEEESRGTPLSSRSCPMSLAAYHTWLALASITCHMPLVTFVT